MNVEDLQHGDTFRDRVSTVDEKGARKWIYALKPSGKFYKSRSFLAYLYILVFLAMPFIKVNGMPFMQFNVLEGKFILFSKIFWPQDFIIFAIAMVSFIIIIALFTVIYGRLFCGWACPQTIFMEFIFRKIEWWIEGPPGHQQSLNKGPWDTKKLFKKALKHFVFYLISFVIANFFLSYIIGMDRLLELITGNVTKNFPTLIGLIFFTFLFYIVFAFIREIVCTTICPYGRLQSVLFDKDTMQISYDYVRGETRGKFSKNKERTYGDCIDCKKCIQVCPTGIDIRDGVQLDCVGCTACIDACDEMMNKVGFAPSLIRYASENTIANKTNFRFNGRMKAYSFLLFFLLIVLSVLIITRRPIDTYISKARGQTYQEVDSLTFSNLYNAKIINKTNKEVPIELSLDGIEGKISIVSNHNLVLKKESINEVTFFIQVPKSALKKRKTPIKVNIMKKEKKLQSVNTTFLGPFI